MKNLLVVCVVIAVASVFQSCSDSTTSPSTDSYRTLRQNRYDKSGVLTNYWDYSYSNNLLLKVSYYDSTKLLISYTEYSHNSSNQRVKSTSYDANGNPSGSYTTFEYNAEGKLTKSNIYIPTRLYGYVTYTFDASGNKVNSTHYSIDSYGIPTQNESTVFLYDSSGKRIRANTYNSSGGLNSYSTNEFSDGRLKKVMFYDEQSKLIASRIFEYEAGISVINPTDFYEY